MKNLHDINIGCSNKQMETLILQMFNPQPDCEYCYAKGWEKWSFEKRKLFRAKVRLLINYYRTMREFGECVKG